MSLERLKASLADRYRIERELGQGGMATVYLAEDLKHERQVAIKVLREDLSASLGAGRFLREIKIAAQLQHPHILPLLDSGEADGFLYFVMPYIKGQSLRERLAREGELPVPEAVRLISEVVDALVEAHAHGVVHRDIKPDNVMLSGRHALVTDFGVAKAISEATGRNTVTTLGVAVGTPTYMSPEQAAADPHVDHRSDIYSVGVMAYEMLSGRPPFTGNTPQQVLAAHVTEAPDSVAKRRPAIPAALEQVVMKCLAKRPADRYQTATELHAALEPLATPSMGITPTHTQPTPAIVRKSRRNAAVLVITGVAVLGAAGWGALHALHHAPATKALPIPIQLTSTGEAFDASISPDGSRVAYAVKRCDPAGLCLFDLVVQDVHGAGTLTISSGLSGVYSTSWSPDSRDVLMTASRGAELGNFLVPASVQGPSRLISSGDISFLTTADTLLITPTGPTTDSLVWFKVETVADGVVRDSIPLHRPRGSLTTSTSRDGRWIALFEYPANDRTTTVRILRRDGHVADTMAIADLWSGELDDTGLHWVRGTFGSTVFDLLHEAIDPQTGRRRGAIDTLWAGVPLYQGSLAMTSDWHSLVFARGTETDAITTLRRPSLASGHFDRRVMAKSTSRIGGTISSDGSKILVTRGQSTATESLKTQLALIPFDSGPEITITPKLDGMFGAGWEADKAAVFYLVPSPDFRDRVVEYDLATKQTRDLFTMPDSTHSVSLASVSGGKFVAFHFNEPFVVVLAPNGVPEHRFPTPPKLTILRLTPAPDGETVALSGKSSEYDSMFVYTVRIADGHVERVAGLLGTEGRVTGWRSNDELLMSIRETTETAALYQIFTDRRPPHRIGIMPNGSYYSSSRDGLRLVATDFELHSDIWMMHDPSRLFRP